MTLEGRTLLMRYWCLSTSKENWEVCKKYSIWGVDYRYFVTLRDFVGEGDTAVVYTHGGEFVAIVHFVGKMKEDFTHIGWIKKGKPWVFPYRIGFRILKEGKVPISFSTVRSPENVEKAQVIQPNLIDKLVFIADKGKTWNQYVQVSMISIPQEDFELIELNL